MADSDAPVVHVAASIDPRPHLRVDLSQPASDASREAAHADTNPRGVHWDGPLYASGGHASLGRHVVRALVSQEQELPVRITPRDDDDDDDARRQRPASDDGWLRQEALRNRSLSGLHVSCDTPTDWEGRHLFAPRREEHPGYQAYVGLSMFEASRLPRGWAAACAGLDEIWVPSRFARELFTRAGVPETKVQIIPVGVECARYDRRELEPLAIPGRRRFMFLSVFDWTLRKGWDVLLDAYGRAFRATDDVCLVLRTASGSRDDRPADAIDAVFSRLGLTMDERPTVILLDAPLSDEDMPRLYRAADAFVLPTRGEGWGLPLMEAMAAGLPVIATHWGGHLDFVNDDVAWLIDVDALVTVPPEYAARRPFYAGARLWAEPSIPHTVSLMRQAFERPDEGRRLGQRAQEAIRRDWSPDRTARWVHDRVHHLAPDPAMLLERARAAEAAGQVNEALMFYAKAAASRPGWGLPAYLHASLLERQGRRREAMALFRTVAEARDPSLDADALCHLGELAWLGGRVDEARELVTACLARAPRHRNARAWRSFLQARDAEQAGAWTAADQAYTDARALRPDWILPVYNQASVARRLGDLVRAQQLFTRVTSLAQDAPLRGGAHYHLATLHEAAGRGTEAATHLDACLHAVPAHAAARALRDRLAGAGHAP